MDKENGKNGSDGNNSGTSKVSNQADASALLDAANLFGAYWPGNSRNEQAAAAAAAAAANMFAAQQGGFGLAGHPFGMVPPVSVATGGGRSVPGLPSYPAASSAASSSAGAAAYSNAYTNTLSVAASQAASLGIPAASAAWWSMASHLAAQDYLARLQASGLNFPSLNPQDPYASLGLSALSTHHKSSSSYKNSKNGSTSMLSKQHQNAKDKFSSGKSNDLKSSKMHNSTKHTSSGLTIQPSIKLHGSNSSVDKKSRSNSLGNDMSSYKSMEKLKNSTSGVNTSSYSTSGKMNSTQTSQSIFTSPLSMVGMTDKTGRSTPNSFSTNSIASINSSILSDPNSILGGVRLPPDTEIIKYTSSIVGPKIPGTTNRGRKKNDLTRSSTGTTRSQRSAIII